MTLQSLIDGAATGYSRRRRCRHSAGAPRRLRRLFLIVRLLLVHRMEATLLLESYAVDTSILVLGRYDAAYLASTAMATGDGCSMVTQLVPLLLAHLWRQGLGFQERRWGRTTHRGRREGSFQVVGGISSHAGRHCRILYPPQAPRGRFGRWHRRLSVVHLLLL